MPFTLEELKIVSGLLDLGVKAAGLSLFQNEGGALLQSALAKLQVMADEAAKPTPDAPKEPA